MAFPVAGVLFIGLPAASIAQNRDRLIYVVVHVDVPPNFTSDTAALLSQFAIDSRKDPGSMRFELMQENSRVNHFTLVEVWRTRRDFESHLATAHSRIFREKLHPMLGSPFDERLNILVR